MILISGSIWGLKEQKIMLQYIWNYNCRARELGMSQEYGTQNSEEFIWPASAATSFEKCVLRGKEAGWWWEVAKKREEKFLKSVFSPFSSSPTFRSSSNISCCLNLRGSQFQRSLQNAIFSALISQSGI